MHAFGFSGRKERYSALKYNDCTYIPPRIAAACSFRSAATYGEVALVSFDAKILQVTLGSDGVICHSGELSGM